MTALKRDIITIIILIVLIIVYVGYHTYDVKKDTVYYPELNEVDMTHISLYDYIHPEITYVCMNMGTEYKGDYYVKYQDDVEELFDKFAFRVEYRDYFRQICSLQNVDPIIAMSVGQIESHSGTHPDYNNRTEERAYWINGVKCWDDGWFQLNSYYHDYFEEFFFNPELIRSLGYIREEFDANDDMISIQVGVAYLGYLYRYYGNYEDAIASYNAGFKRVSENNLLPSTVRYVKAIMNNQRYLYEG